MIYTFLVNGFEEIEALAPVDILKRAGFEVTLVSAQNTLEVECARKTKIICDKTIDETDFSDARMILLPGGPGSSALDDERIRTVIENVLRANGLVGAICAAPHVLGKWGMLSGKRATCFPGFEKYLEGAQVTGEYVTVDLPFVTAAGAGSALEYGYKLVEVLKGKEAADGLRNSMRGPVMDDAV